MSKEQMKKLLNLADSEAERERLRFAVVRGGLECPPKRHAVSMVSMT